MRIFVDQRENYRLSSDLSEYESIGKKSGEGTKRSKSAASKSRLSYSRKFMHRVGNIQIKDNI